MKTPRLSFFSFNVSFLNLFSYFIIYLKKCFDSKALLKISRPLPSPADDPNGEPDPTGVVNTNEAFCTVVQTRLSDHRLLFSGEVDCRDKDPGAPHPPACYVELKTSAEICTPKQRSNFHRSGTQF